MVWHRGIHCEPSGWAAVTSAKVCPCQTLSTEALLSVLGLPFPFSECKECPAAGCAGPRGRLRNSGPWPSCRAALMMMGEVRWLLLPFCGRHLSIQSGVSNLGNHYSKSCFRPVDIAASTLYLFSQSAEDFSFWKLSLSLKFTQYHHFFWNHRGGSQRHKLHAEWPLTLTVVSCCNRNGSMRRFWVSQVKAQLAKEHGGLVARKYCFFMVWNTW